MRRVLEIFTIQFDNDIVSLAANKNECTNKIPRSSAFCKKNYDFGKW